MDVKECLEQGLLKKDLPSKEKAQRSLEMAEYKLQEADKIAQLKIFDMAQVSAYSAMFHASRAILFRDGYKERSHFAIYVYLKEKYSDKIELRFLNELNVQRLQRHEIFYGLEKVEIKEIELSQIINIVKEFIKNIKKII